MLTGWAVTFVLAGAIAIIDVLYADQMMSTYGRVLLGTLALVIIAVTIWNL
ncbi:hypothetical protein HNO88_004107 [Novosphingobium chloroacetimidivorans]|uniref:Uncharacterized protein n=1 Tax=Novosphingobium chloroacetimidivorans TaxID=1428314 RepID=A0A7W7KDF2_9SPHN|nr:hypothetical protein [Novosphingobium chloroacetimidivorans]MBB4860762.1 hypothetical protein [Novosphingobium chloroacetimidivorans]